MNNRFFKQLEKRRDAAARALEEWLTPLTPEDSPREIRTSKPTMKHPLPDSEQQLLLELFCKYPGLAPKIDMSTKSKAQLRAIAENTFCCNEALIQKKQATDNFISHLHSNMVRDSGLLGIVNIMLQAAKNNEAIRWEAYCGHARQQIQELLLLEQAQSNERVTSEKASGFPTKQLVDRIQDQIIQLQSDPLRTEYFPLYRSLKQIPLEKIPADLSAWYQQVSFIMQGGMAGLPLELRDALLEDYPSFRFS